MGANLDQFKVVSEKSNYAKFNGLVRTVESSLRNIGDQTKNAWGSGLILAPNQISQGGASSGQTLAWNGSAWTATTIPTYTKQTATTTVDVVNTTTETDLFSGATTFVTGGFNSNFNAGVRTVLTAGGDYLNNSAGTRRITLHAFPPGGGDWQDQSPLLAISATRRAWNLRIDMVGLGSVFAYSGVFVISDPTAASTGSGALRTPANTDAMAVFTGSCGLPRMFFTCTHDLANANVSMRCFYARVETIT